ncbi:hypothetical protein Syun_010048 [Stephania yunnanensis]|uniref:Uncharacterized protein n=1 Tax=Stephania yunnanensis TaxID=152371 RepID=A0AAP0KHX7_9MAGN
MNDPKTIARREGREARVGGVAEPRTPHSAVSSRRARARREGIWGFWSQEGREGGVAGVAEPRAPHSAGLEPESRERDEKGFGGFGRRRPRSARSRNTYAANPVLVEGESVYDYCCRILVNVPDLNTCVFASTTRDHPIHLWDATSGQVIEEILKHEWPKKVAKLCS